MNFEVPKFYLHNPDMIISHMEYLYIECVQIQNLHQFHSILIFAFSKPTHLFTEKRRVLEQKLSSKEPSRACKLSRKERERLAKRAKDAPGIGANTPMLLPVIIEGLPEHPIVATSEDHR